MAKRALVLLTIALVTFGVAAGNAATPAQVARANRAVAISAADDVVGRLALPIDAKRSAGEPAGDDGELTRAVSVLWYEAEVDGLRFWVTNARPSAVLSSIAAHAPAGAMSAGAGWVGAPNLDSMESWSLPTVDAAQLGQRLLVVDATKLANGQTGIRADVWVQYIAPRPTAQRVPAQARVLDVSVTDPISGKVVRALAVTNRRTVRRIAALVDALPFGGGPQGYPPLKCPRFPSDTLFDTFRFRATRAASALATVSLFSGTPDAASPCADASLSIRGHRQPPLAGGGALLTRAGAILKVKLADTAVSTT